MEFNLESLALSDTTRVHLKHPITEELLYADAEMTKPVVSVLYGTSSKQYRQTITAMQNRALKRQGKKMTAEEIRQEGVELLVACSQCIENLSYKGAPVDNADAFRALYNDPKFSWLKEQHDAAIGDMSNFLEQ